MAAEDYFDFEDPRNYDDEPDDGWRPPRVHLKPFWLSGTHSGVDTEKAVLWQMLNGTKEWFPRSHIIELQRDKMLISGWIKQQKNINESFNQQPLSENPPPVNSIEDYGFTNCEPDYP
jgi:hypothetical protein